MVAGFSTLVVVECDTPTIPRDTTTRAPSAAGPAARFHILIGNSVLKMIAWREDNACSRVQGLTRTVDIQPVYSIANRAATMRLEAPGAPKWWDYARAFSNPAEVLVPVAPVEDAIVADWDDPP